METHHRTLEQGISGLLAQKRAHACKCVEAMGNAYKRDACSYLTPIN